MSGFIGLADIPYHMMYASHSAAKAEMVRDFSEQMSRKIYEQIAQEMELKVSRNEMTGDYQMSAYIPMSSTSTTNDNMYYKPVSRKVKAREQMADSRPAYNTGPKLSKNGNVSFATFYRELKQEITDWLKL